MFTDNPFDRGRVEGSGIETGMFARRAWQALPEDISPEARLVTYQALLASAVANPAPDRGASYGRITSLGDIDAANAIVQKPLSQHIEERGKAIDEVRRMLAELSATSNADYARVLSEVVPDWEALDDLVSGDSDVKTCLVNICDQITGLRFPKEAELEKAISHNGYCERNVGGVSMPIFDFSYDDEYAELFDSRNELESLRAQKDAWKAFVADNPDTFSSLAEHVKLVRNLVDAVADDQLLDAYATTVAAIGVTDERVYAVGWTDKDVRHMNAVTIGDIVELDVIVRSGLDPKALAALLLLLLTS